MTKRQWRKSAWTCALLVTVFFSNPSVGVGQEASSTGTRAVQFMSWGTVGGGVLGGASLGVLSWGLCEASDCSDSFTEGFFWGALGGAVYGAITGLVTGSAFRRGPRVAESEEPPVWTWAISGGPAWAGGGEFEGWRPVAGVGMSRPTAGPVTFGWEAHHLGRSADASEFVIPDPRGDLVRRRSVRRHMFAVGMVARAHLRGLNQGLVLMASSGAYPIWEALTFETESHDTGGPLLPGGDERGWAAFPGVGMGLGYISPVRGRAAFELYGRIHGVIGAGDTAVLPIFQVSGGVRF